MVKLVGNVNSLNEEPYRLKGDKKRFDEALRWPGGRSVM